MWDTLRSDLAGAVRGLTAARGFTALTVLALALGLGANGAVFAVVDGVLLKPLPYAAPERLAMLWSENPRAPGETNPLSPANFDDLRTMSQSFETLDYALSFLVRVAVDGQEDQACCKSCASGRRCSTCSGCARSWAARSPPTRATSPSSVTRLAHPLRRRPRRDWPPHRRDRERGVDHRRRGPAEFVFPLRDMLWQAGTATPQAADMWVAMRFEGPRFVAAQGGYARSFHALMAVGRLRRA